MTKAIDELRAAAVRLKRDVDELVRRIEELPRAEADLIRRDASRPEEQVLFIAQRAVDLYAARRPRPVQVTMTQAAEMLGLSRHTVSKMLRAGQFKLNKCGLIPIEQVDRALANPDR